MIGIAQVYDADIAITAEANGRCFFGDKISPLSDTTHIASLASGVPCLIISALWSIPLVQRQS